MKQLIVAEFERILSRKSTKILLLISILFPILSYLMYQSRWGSYTEIVNKISLPINSLSYSVYNFADFNILLVFILLPLLLSESLSAEIDSGAYRLILLRPIEKWKFIVVKWVTLPVTYACMLLCVFLSKTFIGLLLLPKVQSTVYYNITTPLNFADSMLYNLKFYAVIFMLHIILLWIVSFVSVFTKKTILTYIGSVGMVICSVYLYQPLSNVFFSTADFGYSILGNDLDIMRLLYILPAIVVLATISLWRWNRNIGYRV